MDNKIIEINNLSVCFNMNREKIYSLKEYMVKFVKREINYDEFWALKNVTFSLERGDILGIIGFNGAGKSTLLKVISRILKPSLGTVKISGEVSPLIELGAGFDMELTARENIFLNGYILGYSKKFLKENFNAIIEYAELKDFVDVPLKNFSSGMIARLGFSIATVKEPDILIVDEILSVGDFKFQEKSEKRIKKMMKGGATVILVSHSIEQIEELCSKVIWLENGEVKRFGESKYICDEYKNS